MQIAISILSLLLAIASIAGFGLGGFDPLYDKVAVAGINAGNIGGLLGADPSNPSIWATYAEVLVQQGDTAGAGAAFTRAVQLGPGMSPVLMRAANFAFVSGDEARALALSKVILEQTKAFDAILFSYLARMGSSRPSMLDAAMPHTPRAVGAWLKWEFANGSDANLMQTWGWLRRHRLSTQSLAEDAVWALWQRKSFPAAHELWSDWVGDQDENAVDAERLSNRFFSKVPSRTPFDWSLQAPQPVKLATKEGLHVTFPGTRDVAFSHVHQFATVRAGRYRFSADVEGQGLVSDQLPFFHVIDAEPHRKVDVRTEPVERNKRSRIVLEFTVPAGMQALEVVLQRNASSHTDAPIAGTLRVYEVSLRRL
jgi:hypothetical protein